MGKVGVLVGISPFYRHWRVLQDESLCFLVLPPDLAGQLYMA